MFHDVLLYTLEPCNPCQSPPGLHFNILHIPVCNPRPPHIPSTCYGCLRRWTAHPPLFERWHTAADKGSKATKAANRTPAIPQPVAFSGERCECVVKSSMMFVAQLVCALSFAVDGVPQHVALSARQWDGTTTCVKLHAPWREQGAHVAPCSLALLTV